MQPIVLCSYEVDAEPIFDATNSFQRAAHFVTDLNLAAQIGNEKCWTVQPRHPTR